MQKHIDPVTIWPFRVLLEDQQNPSLLNQSSCPMGKRRGCNDRAAKNKDKSIKQEKRKASQNKDFISILMMF